MKINIVHSKYRVEFGTCSGLMGAYIGDTLEDLRQAIEADNRLDRSMKNSLMYGWFWEFEKSPMSTKEYVIDNAIHFMWTIR